MLKDMLEAQEEEVQINEIIFKTEEILNSLEHIHANISLISSMKPKIPTLTLPFFYGDPLR